MSATQIFKTLEVYSATLLDLTREEAEGVDALISLKSGEEPGTIALAFHGNMFDTLTLRFASRLRRAIDAALQHARCSKDQEDIRHVIEVDSEHGNNYIRIRVDELGVTFRNYSKNHKALTDAVTFDEDLTRKFGDMLSNYVNLT